MEAAERAGAMVTEQIRAITEAAEHQAGDLRREAEADAESLGKESRDAARGILERIDRLEAAVQQLIGSVRHEADALSRLAYRGQSARSNRPGRSAPPVEPLALHPGSADREEPLAPTAPDPAPEGEGILEAEQADEPAGPASPIAESPGPEIVASSGGALEPEGLEHPPTVDHAEPALEDEQVSDYEAPKAEPYSEVELEPPLDVEPLETSEPLPEAHQPDAPEPPSLDEAEIAPPEPGEIEEIEEAEEAEEAEEVDESGEPEESREDEPLTDVAGAEAEPYSGLEGLLEDEWHPEAGQSPLETQPPEEVLEPPLESEPIEEPEPPLESEPIEESEPPLEPEPEFVPPPEQDLVESKPIEEPELRSTEDHLELEDDVEVDRRDDAAPGEQAGAIDDTSARPAQRRQRGLRGLFARRFPLQPSEDEQSSEDVPNSEEGLGAEEGSAEDRVPGDPLESGIEEPPPADDEHLVSPPLVVQQGWWEHEASEGETPTGEPSADAETDMGEAPSDASQDERHANVGDANVGASLGGISPSRPDASVETPQCGACNRVHEGSVEVAEAEGWLVAGTDALCERCRAAGWRLPEVSDQPSRRGWGSRFS
jgi:hypothetical protein